jgi:biotin carboxyl carrier protein
VNFDVFVNGRTWKVGVEPGDRDERLRVTVKGLTRTMLAAWIDPATLSLIADEDQAARSYEIGVRKIGPVDLEITLDGRVATAQVSSVTERAKPPATPPSRSDESPGVHALVSPMPGRVVRVLAADGERVAAGQGIVVIEAMKMENELRSPIDGVVTKMAARQDAAIESGVVLAVIEPCR